MTEQKEQLRNSDVAKPHVVIVFTGGTIASTLDAEWGGVVPSLSGGRILERVPELTDSVQITVEEFGTYPGPHITPALMLRLATVVRQYVERNDVDGVIVTHGTDTLEETAFFLDCTVETAKPIVVIGAMRNSSEPDWDGPRNIRDGVRVASNASARNKGVLVCLGGVLTAASETSKTDTDDVNTFRSEDFGSLGRVSNGNVMIHRGPVHRDHYHPETVDMYVPLVKCYAGMGPEFIRFARENGAAGIVVEAFGVGNVTPLVYHECAAAVADGLPVVLVSRCPVGRIEHTYAYEGAGLHLHKAGVIFADYLNGQKARIRLLCALGSGMSVAQIRERFEWVHASEQRS
jgi:L-asparaginase